MYMVEFAKIFQNGPRIQARPEQIPGKDPSKKHLFELCGHLFGFELDVIFLLVSLPKSLIQFCAQNQRR